MSSTYPGSLDTDNNLYVLVNNAATTLASAYTTPATTIDLTDATLFPTTGGPFYVDGERGHYTGKTVNQLTGVTGLGNNHLSTVAVRLNLDEEHHNFLKDAIIALQTLLGITGDTTAGRIVTELAKLNSNKLSVTTTPTTLTIPQSGMVLYDTTVGILTSNLPTAVGNSGVWFWLKNAAGSNNVIMDANSTETIDDNLTLTIAPGDAYTIRSDGANWVIVGMYNATGLSNIIEDITPQLGGNLDANGFDVIFNSGDGILDSNTNIQLLFTLIASAVNYINITNAVTGVAPRLEAAGETNVDFVVRGKGTGGLSGEDSILKRYQQQDLSAIVKDHGTISSTQTLTLNYEEGNVHKLTVSGTPTITLRTNNWPVSGSEGFMLVKITNGDLATWVYEIESGNNVPIWIEGGVAPALSASGLDELTLSSGDASTTVYAGHTGP